MTRPRSWSRIPKPGPDGGYRERTFRISPFIWGAQGGIGYVRYFFGDKDVEGLDVVLDCSYLQGRSDYAFFYELLKGLAVEKGAAYVDFVRLRPDLQRRVRRAAARLGVSDRIRFWRGDRMFTAV